MTTTTSLLRKRQGRLVVVLGMCFIAACGASDATTIEETAEQGSALTGADRAPPNPAVFPSTSLPYGQTMEDWLEDWWRWVMSIPPETNPLLHPTQDSNVNQSGPVYFLAPGNRTNTVPLGMAIAVTPSTSFLDYPCPDPTFEPAPGQSLFDFLLAGTTPVQDGVVELAATLDGRALEDLFSTRVTSEDLMSFTGNPSLQTTFDNCITGSSQPGVADGFFFVLKPLSPGRHVLTTHVVNQAGHVFDRTQNLDVQ